MQIKKIILITMAALCVVQWASPNNKNLQLETKTAIDKLKNTMKMANLEVKYPTDYLYNPNNKSYKQPNSEFSTVFLESAKKGANTFWAQVKEASLEKPGPLVKTSTTTLDNVIDLVNFFLFAALPSGNDTLELANIAFEIQVFPALAAQLDNFFKSYKANKSAKLFQESSHKPWYSIHLRDTEEQSYRYYWLGNTQFKSFGIGKIDDYTLRIIPHNDNYGRPTAFGNYTNTVDLTLNGLISAYLILNSQEEQFKKELQVITDISSAAKNSVDDKIIDNGMKLLSDLRQSTDSIKKVILAPYIESLILQYKQTFAKKSSYTLRSIKPSEDQLNDSLGQYSLTPIKLTDRKAFHKSARRGTRYLKQLLFGKNAPKLKGEEIEENQTEDEATSRTNRLKDYLTHIVDINNFLYTLAIFSRDDGVGPATVTFHILGNEKFEKFIYDYLRVIESYHLELGTEKSMIGANPFAYLRKQSHHFSDAWGLEMRWLAEKFNANTTQDPQPYLFPARWTDNVTAASVAGPQFHLLVGKNPLNKQALFFKWEERGLYGGSVVAHGKDLLLSLARKKTITRKLFGLTPDDAPQYNKERVPSIIAETINEMGKANKITVTDELKANAKNAISVLWAYCQTTKGLEPVVEFLERTFDHPDRRWGNEIIIAPYRDWTVVAIEYFTTKDKAAKQLYKNFLELMRYTIAFANKTPITTDETKSMVEIGRIDSETLREKIETFTTNFKEYPTSLSNSYLKSINKLFTKLLNLDNKPLEEFLERYARNIFDTFFIDSTIKSALEAKIEEQEK